MFDTMLDRSGAATHGLVDELRAELGSDDFVGLLHRSDSVASSAGRAPNQASLVVDLGSLASQGPLAALLAIESLAEVGAQGADLLLVELLSHSDRIVRRHASWRLGGRLPVRRAYRPLLDALVLGGIDTMHAHRTLRGWAASDAESILGLVFERLESDTGAAARARLTDLLGAIPSPMATESLVGIALDAAEGVPARVAALGALGERAGERVAAALRSVAAHDGELGAHAALALGSLEVAATPAAERPRDGGLRIAQLVLAGGLDGQLSLGGRGETGGVASLLVSLGEALVRRPDVEHVLTIGRGTVTDALTGPLASSEDPLSYGMIAIGDEVRRAANPDEIWEHLPAIERGIRRVLRLSGPIDVLHLRMADAGTLAGAEVARAAGLPICFSLAPDPHNVVQSLQSRGELNHDSFVQLDDQSHVWFRARIIERLARDADRLALFPRAEPLELLGDLGIDVDGSDHRVAVVAEGIDISLLDRAAAESTQPTVPGTRHGDVLDDLAALIPDGRRGLPLVLSVGRLHPVKGMDRLVSAWASDPHVHETCNLVIVGGALDDPSASERHVLDAIERTVPPTDPRRAGLVLLGGRPRADVARLQVATMTGRADCWAAGGVYVDGALKEEFGLAVIEALAAGLVVVAPSTGGPPTYVVDGDTGVLVDPDADLAHAICTAFGLVDRPDRAQRARRMVEERYSIDTMATQLVDLYRPSLAML